MKKLIIILALGIFTMLNSYADRIYIMNSPGYNTCGPDLIAAITANGHTITNNTGPFNLPAGFTSTCNDPVNGYDWLCFFGNNDFTAMIPQIQAFIDAGGKVYYQYEVSCCTVSASAAAQVAAALTGLPITTNINDYIALDVTAQGGWQATSLGCCAPTFEGNAYKGMDGLPAANQLNATANINGSSPAIGLCTNFGFYFTTTDFGAPNQGAIVGIGDINFWYDGAEPGGFNPVNPAVVDWLFPATGSTCHLFPPGCMTSYNNPTMAVDLGNDTTMCNGGSLLLDATTAGATYVWQDNSTNPTFNVTTSGTYYVEVSNACDTTSDTIVVTIAAGPSVNLGPNTSICPGDTLLLDATTAGATYQWQDNSTNPTLTVTSAGTYWVEVDVSGCTGGDTIDVTIGNSISVDLGNDTTICLPNTFVLNATTPGATYQWQDNSTNPTFTATTTGTYWVQVTNSCGTANDSINLTFNPSPSVSLGNDTTLCQGEILQYDVTTPGAQYKWNDNSILPTFTINTAGTYWVEVDLGGCNDADTVNVQYHNINVATLGIDTTLCDGETLVLNATTANSTYLWQDGSTNPTFVVTVAGNYGVTIFTPCGNFMDSAQVQYQNCECYLFVPNAFTPNDDKLNSTFFPVTTCHMKTYRFIIFDRWGKELFSTDDPSLQWNGSFNGKQYPIGVYAYRLEYEFAIPHSKPETKIGHVNLIR